MVLTFIAEVLSGETLVTPGGAVDMATATGAEAFTWDGWLHQLQSDGSADDAAETGIELAGEAATPIEALVAE